MSTPRIPAPNHEAERRAVSCLLKSPADVLAAAAAGLEISMFTLAPARAIYGAMLEAANAREETDVASLVPRLANLSGNMRVDIPRLVEIDALEPTSANRAKWVDAVIVSHRRRAAAKHLLDALEHINEDTHSWDDMRSTVAADMEAATVATAPRGSRSLSDIVDSYIAARSDPARRRGIDCGLSHWSRESGPWRRGEMVILAGRPGAGKTALALQVAAYASRHHGRVLFASMEMEAEELIGRLTLMSGGPEAQGDRQDAIARSIAIADGIKKSLPKLTIHDMREGCDYEHIDARARVMAAAPDGLALIVVDYLQLLTPPKDSRKESRERQVGEMSRRFKMLAGACRCPVLVLSQLNRGVEKEDRLPRMSDLRESGTLEQDADRIWLLAIDPDWLDSTPLPLPDTIHVRVTQAKCRGGRPDIHTVTQFQRPYFRFREIARATEEERE